MQLSRKKNQTHKPPKPQNTTKANIPPKLKNPQITHCIILLLSIHTIIKSCPWLTGILSLLPYTPVITRPMMLIFERSFDTPPWF